jgi:uncharacterized protein (DUF302 family)
MTRDFAVRKHVHVSSRSFEEVVAAFEAAVGSVEGGGFEREVEAAPDPAAFEARLRSHEGTSGFMRFSTIDHGAWLSALGIAPGAKARLYTIGNPLIARTMIKHDLGVGLDVPVRVLIYEDPPSGAVRLAYDLPSSLMSGLRNPDVDVAARNLDAKLVALAEVATGSSA